MIKHIRYFRIISPYLIYAYFISLLSTCKVVMVSHELQCNSKSLWICLQVLNRDTDCMEYEMCHLNTSQLSTIIDVPPDYQTVEEEDNELPSYDEALLEHMESGVHSSL